MSAGPKASAPKRAKKWRSFWMGPKKYRSLGVDSRCETPGWLMTRRHHQVVPAFCTPIPTKSGGPFTSPGSSAGGSWKSKPTSQA